MNELISASKAGRNLNLVSKPTYLGLLNTIKTLSIRYKAAIMDFKMAASVAKVKL